MQVNLYKMKLGEHKLFEQYWRVLRVPGGWIFYKKGLQEGVFVPFHKEFDN